MTDRATASTYSLLPNRLAWLAVVLAFAAGATDAFAFLQLSGVFTANMTGNLVLAGLTEREGYANSIGGIVVAIVVFIAVLYAAFRIAPAGSKHMRQAGVLAAALVAAAPVSLIVTVAGLAVLGALVGGITSALEDPQHRIAAILTFLVVASGVSVAGIGSAFWGLIVGGIVMLWLSWTRKPTPEPAR